MSQSELARRSGIERTQLCRALTGRRPFKADELTWLAGALRVELGELVSDTDADPSVVDQARSAAQLIPRALRLERELQTERAARAAVEEELRNTRVLLVTTQREFDLLRTGRNAELSRSLEEQARLKQALAERVLAQKKAEAKSAALLARCEKLEKDKSGAAVIGGLLGIVIGAHAK